MRTPTSIAVATLTASLGLSGCGVVSFGEDESGGDYPSDSIEVVIATSAGGPTDTNGRILLTCMEDELGETIVVKNVDGASGAVGNREVITSEPDGYTLSLTPSTGLTLSPFLEDLGFGVDDVRSIGMLFHTAMVFAVPKGSQFESAEALFDYAEQNPGDLKVGIPGPTSPKAVILDALRAEGIDLEPVPLEGQSGVTTAGLGGNVDVAALEATDDVKSYFDNGRLTPLLAISPGIPEWLPEVPTLDDLGYPDAMLPDNTYPLYGPADLPDDVTTTLEGAMGDCLEDDEVIDTIGTDYATLPFEGADDTDSYMQESSQTYEEIVQ